MQFLNNLRIALSLLWQSAPYALCLTIASNLLVSVIPTLLLYFNAQLIERLSSNMAAAMVMSLLLPYLLLSGFQDSLSLISNFSVDTLRDAVHIQLKHRVNSMIATFPNLRIHENPALRETAILASRAGEAVGNLLLSLYIVSSRIIMLVPLLLLLGQTRWWVPLFLLAGMLPVLIIRAGAERKSWNVQENHAATFNQLRLLERVLTQAEFAKDLRIYRMQTQLLAQWQQLFQRYQDQVHKVRMHNAIKLLTASSLASICLGIPLYTVITGFQQGQFGIAQLALLLGGLVQMNDSLGIIIYNYGELMRQSHSVKPFGRLLTLFEENTQAAQAVKNKHTCPADDSLLVLEHTGFSYDNCADSVLDDINLSIRHGEVIAIVGDNGAGKSTLLKLLSGFYQPTRGCLRWNDSNKPPRVIGVFQDFARFPLSTSENLALHDPLRGAECLSALGLSFLIDKMAVPLSAEVHGGIDLSGGQWQRLAIARAMAHADEADLLLFDEPTSALDPETEAGIMHRILQLSRQKTAVIASHRLALTRFVDRIVVLHQGKIVEQGSHEVLMALKGKYARMFLHQARFYQDKMTDADSLADPASDTLE